MKQTLILPVVALALFSGIGVAQTSSSQKSVIISRGDHVEVQLTDANGTVTTHTGATTADAIAKFQSVVSSSKQVSPLLKDQHLTPSGSQTINVTKTQTDPASIVKSSPVMATPVTQVNSAPKN